MAQRPMYQQIAEDLRAQIESGALEQGAQLPTELELRDRYESSRNTIRDAIKRLTSQGLVETRPGQGTFVTRRVDPFVTVLTGDPSFRGVPHRPRPDGRAAVRDGYGVGRGPEPVHRQCRGKSPCPAVRQRLGTVTRPPGAAAALRIPSGPGATG